MKKLACDTSKLVFLAAVIFGTAQLGAVGSGAELSAAVLFALGCYGAALAALALNGYLEQEIERERKAALRRRALRRLAGAVQPVRPVPTGRAA